MKIVTNSRPSLDPTCQICWVAALITALQQLPTTVHSLYSRLFPKLHFFLVLLVHCMKRGRAWDTNVWHLLVFCCPRDLLSCLKSKLACSDVLLTRPPRCYLPPYGPLVISFFLSVEKFLAFSRNWSRITVLQFPDLPVFGISSVFHNFSEKSFTNGSEIISASPLEWMLEWISMGDPIMK